MSGTRSAGLSGHSVKPRPGSEPLDGVLGVLFMLGAVLVAGSTLFLMRGVHGLTLAGLVLGALIGAGASLTYGIRHSGLRLSLGIALAYIVGAVWQIIPPDSKPSWSGLVPAVLVALAFIPWFLLLRRVAQSKG